MTTFLTSDLHLGHENIRHFEPASRPFPDAASMNEAIVDRWNEAVGPDDTVYVLGDVAMGRIADSLPLVGLLNGRKLLVPGNHDRCWTGHRKVGTWPRRYVDAGFAEVLDPQVELDEFLLCHFPYAGDSGFEDRYVDHRPANRGRPLLHGHVHGAWRVNGRQVNVGVDVWDLAPVSLDRCREALATGS